jgi:hypothetical protein
VYCSINQNSSFEHYITYYNIEIKSLEYEFRKSNDKQEVCCIDISPEDGTGLLLEIQL